MQQESEYQADEAVKIVEDDMQGTVSESEMAQVREIVLQEHLEPIIGSKDKYRLKNNPKFDEVQTADISDKNLLHLFDQKLSTLKQSMKNFIKDFSSWQTVQGEKNRQIRDLDSRISELESQHEDLDLESLEGRGQIAISDIVTLMKQMQIDILKKCATTTEILSLRTEIKDIEENSNKILQHHMKTNKMAETVDNMNVIAAKIKDMQMDSMRNQNRILENNRRLEDTLSRIHNLENIHRKGTKLENALANAANLDGRQIIEAVLEVTSEI